MSMQREVEAISRKLAALKKVEVPRAISSALNKTVSKSKTQIARAVKSETGVASSVLKTRIYTKNAKSNKLKAYLRAYRRDIPAISLGVAQTRLKVRGGRIVGGGSIRVGNKTFKNAFVNKVRKNETFQVMRRLGKSRYPIDVVAVKVTDAIDKHARKTVYSIYNSDFEKTLINDLNFRVSKYAKSE